MVTLEWALDSEVIWINLQSNMIYVKSVQPNFQIYQIMKSNTSITPVKL